MTGKQQKPTPAENLAARNERRKILRKIRAMKDMLGPHSCKASLDQLEAWILRMDERAAKREGGVGRK